MSIRPVTQLSTAQPASSLYDEFANAKPVARARLWPSWSNHYPALRPE